MDLRQLVAQKSELIAQKKQVPRWGAVDHTPALKTGAKSFEQIEDGVARVRFVGNTYNWLDSDMDILVPGAAAKSIMERGPKARNLIAHLRDHKYDVTARVGSLVDVKEEQYEGDRFGLVFESDIRRSYNEKVYEQYERGDINQHSIGFRYTKLDLAVNDPSQEEYKAWEQYRQDIINPERADELGYFWVVKEIMLLEVSSVLWGANSETGMLSSEPTVSLAAEPSEDTLRVLQSISETLQKTKQ